VATTELQIANSALVKVGADRILSLDDDNKRARVVKEQLPKLRDEVLYSHPWKFALDYRELGLISGKPVGPFSLQYLLPNDVLRVFTVTDGTVLDAPEFSPRVVIHPWKRVGNKIYAELNPLIIECVVRVTDVSLWSPTFAEVLALRLAADIAYSIVQSTTLMREQFLIYEDFLAVARSFNGQEGSVRQVTASQWLDSRS